MKLLNETVEQENVVENNKSIIDHVKQTINTTTQASTIQNFNSNISNGLIKAINKKQKCIWN